MSAYAEWNQINYGDLSPGEIVTYLRVHEWSEEKRVGGGRGSVWVSASSERLLVPLDANLRDYEANVAQLLYDLSKLERRTIKRVHGDIVTASTDVLRVRMVEVEDDGTLGLDRGIATLTHARDMMLAAACSSIDPKAYYPSRKFKDAEEYVGGLKLGHTEPGSFVLRILSPVPPSLQGSLAADDVDDVLPFSRGVMTTLMNAVAATQEAAWSASLDGDIRPLRQMIPYGASANLFDALQGLSLCGRDEDFELEVTWAKNRETPTDTPTHITFSRGLAPILQEASTIFKRRYGTREEYELEGVVIRIEREHQDTGSSEEVSNSRVSKEGIVTILGSVGNRTSRVRMVLRDDDYARAITAFEQHEVVRVFGDLHRRRNAYTLESPRAFSTIPNDVLT